MWWRGDRAGWGPGAGGWQQGNGRGGTLVWSLQGRGTLLEHSVRGALLSASSGEGAHTGGSAICILWEGAQALGAHAVCILWEGAHTGAFHAICSLRSGAHTGGPLSAAFWEGAHREPAYLQPPGGCSHLGAPPSAASGASSPLPLGLAGAGSFLLGQVVCGCLDLFFARKHKSSGDGVIRSIPRKSCFFQPFSAQARGVCDYL